MALIGGAINTSRRKMVGFGIFGPRVIIHLYTPTHFVFLYLHIKFSKVISRERKSRNNFADLIEKNGTESRIEYDTDRIEANQ